MLVPAVSQAVVTSQGVDVGLTPICTHAGLKWVDVATGEARDAPAGVDVASRKITPAMRVVGGAKVSP